MYNAEDELYKLRTENAHLRKKNLACAASVSELLDEIDELSARTKGLIKDNEELIEENAELSQLNNNLRGQVEFLDKEVDELIEKNDNLIDELDSLYEHAYELNDFINTLMED